MSRWSVVMTSSIQSPPLPRTRPKCASDAVPGGTLASCVAVPPPRNVVAFTPLYSLSTRGRQLGQSSARTAERSADMSWRFGQSKSAGWSLFQRFSVPNEEWLASW